MPYESDAQRRWAHTRRGIEALGGRDKVAEWDRASKGMNLPARRAEGGSAPESHLAPRANIRYSGGLPLADPMINFSTPQRALPWGPDAFAGPGGLPLGPGTEGRPSRGDQLRFESWVPAFWPPETGSNATDIPDAPAPSGDAPRVDISYPTETLPQAEPPPLPDFLGHPGAQALPSGQFMPNWIPPIEPMERQGYDSGGSIAGIPINQTMDQLNQLRGNPELLRPLTQVLENIQVPGEIGPAEQLRGMSQFPFQNLGRTFGLTPMSSAEIWQRMMEQGYSDPGTGAQNIYDYIMQDPGNSNRIWEYLDPTWPVDLPQQQTPAPAPQEPPAPAPQQPAPAPIDYTYPTETLPRAEPPPQPVFSNVTGPRGQQWGQWIPPIQPLQIPQLQSLPGANSTRGPHGLRYARGGRVEAKDIDRARLRALVSAKRGD